MPQTIKEFAALVAVADRLSPDDLPAVDKVLRNLTQRYPLPPSTLVGKAHVYEPDVLLCAYFLFVAQTAGIERPILHPWCLWLLENMPAALARVASGADVDFNIDYRGNGKLHFWCDFAPSAPHLWRFTVPAAGTIRRLINAGLC
ncbi:hypothetical protein ACEPPZ_06035 [Paracoccus yeei]|uniref:hypothetical protein n=1 Tax=Paracoccus yeei TaxID=147645 RepID=UPI0028D222CD|nr:hypothetical protein [Paracoccus yeei]